MSRTKIDVSLINPVSSSLAMGSNKITGLAAASISGDALSWGNIANVSKLTQVGINNFTLDSSGTTSQIGANYDVGTIGNTANSSAAINLLCPASAASVTILASATINTTPSTIATFTNASVTFAAPLSMGSNKITSLAAPGSTGDALSQGNVATVTALTSTSTILTGNAQIASNMSVTGLNRLNNQNNTSGLVIQGFQNGVDGQTLWFYNNSTSTVSIVHIGSGTQVIKCPGGTNATISSFGGGFFIYDSTGGAWFLAAKS